jgi:cell division protein ZapE
MSNTPLLSPLDIYQQALAQGFVSDPAQQAAVVALNDCFRALHPAPQGQALPENAHQEAHQGQTRGVYLWGPVGRGKTWLMDSFFTTLRVPAKRQHFHHFLAWLHRRLFELTGTINPLQQVAEELAEDIQVLCFDELFVSDIGDAMLLGPLFQALFDAGVVLVTTSNQPPQALYEDGFNRERFLPAIDALLAHTQVVHLDGEQDHRLHGDKTLERYFVSDSTGVPSTQLEHLFTQLSTAKAGSTRVQIGSRQLHALGAHQQTLWCDFAQLCEGTLAAQDYMQLCQQYQHILLSGIPNLSAAQQQARIARGTEDAAVKVDAGDRVLLNLAKNDDAVRRFIALVDECYEQKVTLYLEAAVPLEQLYTEGALLFPFQRARSRIEEMQRKA